MNIVDHFIECLPSTTITISYKKEINSLNKFQNRNEVGYPVLKKQR